MDELTKKEKNKLGIKRIAIRICKAALKSAIFYIIFSVFTMIIAPFENIFNYQSSIVFMIVYICFIFVSELTRGTIYYHVFSIANSLVFVAYIAQMLNLGVIDVSYEQFNLYVDLRFFLSVFIIGGFLGFARNMLNLLKWINEQEEYRFESYIKSL